MRAGHLPYHIWHCTYIIIMVRMAYRRITLVVEVTLVVTSLTSL